METHVEYVAVANRAHSAPAPDVVADALWQRLRPEIVQLIAAGLRFQIEIHAGEGGTAPTIKIVKFLAN